MATFEEYNRGRGRASVTADVSAPSTKGYEHAVSAQQRYLNTLGELTAGVGNLANMYQGIMNERYARDADTQASKIFRERRVEVLQTVKGKDADGLLDREEQWAKEHFEEFAENNKGNREITNKVWQKYTDNYLDRTGAYQIEQQTIADKNSRLEAVDEKISGLATTALGDVGSIREVYAAIDKDFANDYATARQLKAEAITKSVTIWARSNPGATLQWYNSNKEALAKDFGRDFDDIQGVMKQAENTIKTEQAHAEAMAARAERIQAKQAKEYDDSVATKAFTLIARGELDSQALWSVTDDPKASASTKSMVFNAFKGAESARATAATAEGKAQLQQTETEFTSRIWQTGMTQEIRTDILKAASEGRLDSAAMTRLNAAGESIASVGNEAKPFIITAMESAKTLYAPQNSMFTMAKPEQQAQLRVIENAINEHVRTVKDPSKLADDLSLTPNSWLSKLMAANPPLKPSMSMRKGALTFPYLQGTLPTATQSGQSTGAPTANFLEWKRKQAGN